MIVYILKIFIYLAFLLFDYLTFHQFSSWTTRCLWTPVWKMNKVTLDDIKPVDLNCKTGLTISTQACLPSMKPLGMELGVRISYLSEKHKQPQTSVKREEYEKEIIKEFALEKQFIHVKSFTRWVPPIPLSELLEDDAVGESLSADTDSLQHTVTPELIQNQVRVQLTRLRWTETQYAKAYDEFRTN